MKKLLLITIVATICVTFSILKTPLASAANPFTNAGKSFGGKIISTSVPLVTCPGGGTVVILSSNIEGLINIGASQIDSSQSAGSRTTGISKALYNVIPYYTQDVFKKPTVGTWILGKSKITPNLTYCQMNIGGAPIPFPVLPTKNYNVSKKPSLK